MAWRRPCIDAILEKQNSKPGRWTLFARWIKRNIFRIKPPIKLVTSFIDKTQLQTDERIEIKNLDVKYPPVPALEAEEQRRKRTTDFHALVEHPEERTLGARAGPVDEEVHRKERKS